MDIIDRKILGLLQDDATLPIAAVGERVGLSQTPCWRRIQKLEEEGVIRRRVALLDRAKLGLAVTVFVAVRTNQHNLAWFERFARVVEEIDEVVAFYRMSGEVDYLLHIVAPDIAGYDAVYKRLIARIELSDVSSAFAMEVIKETTRLPLVYAR
jgi:Lrp/AsnC family transcriptional regulator, cysteine-sensing transcriptional activator